MQTLIANNNSKPARRRYFLATQLATNALMEVHLRDRRSATGMILGHIQALMKELAKKTGRKIEDLAANGAFQLSGATLDGAPLFGELRMFRATGAFPRNALPGWTNPASRSVNKSVTFTPVAGNLAVRKLPKVPGAPALAKAIGWKFYTKANEVVGAPIAWQAGARSGFSVGAVPLFSLNPKLEQRLRAWQPPSGFMEISETRYNYFIAAARLEEEDLAIKAAA